MILLKTPCLLLSDKVWIQKSFKISNFQEPWLQPIEYGRNTNSFYFLAKSVEMKVHNN